jgi:hypothetical protein
MLVVVLKLISFCVMAATTKGILIMLVSVLDETFVLASDIY